MSVDVYVLAGKQSTGKSSTIRFLSGKMAQSCVKKSIAISANIKLLVKVFSKVQSLQEGEISAKKFQQTVQRKTSGKSSFPPIVIVALRTDSVKQFPKAENYIDEFVKFGWNIKYVAELHGKGLEKYCKKKYEYKSFPRTKTINQLCSNVKKFFEF